MLVFHIAQGTNRFGTLSRAVPVIPRGVEYSLTALGRTLLPVVDAMR